MKFRIYRDATQYDEIEADEIELIGQPASIAIRRDRHDTGGLETIAAYPAGRWVRVVPEAV